MTDSARVQAAVEAVASDVGCPVLIEDARHQPLWWSAQVEADPVRLRTLLERSVAPEAADMVRRLDLARSAGPVRTPEVPEIGMRERWCVPIRKGRSHLGYLWVVDGDGVVPESALPDLVACAELAGDVLARVAATAEESARQRAALLDRLVRGSDQEAARELIDLDQLPHDVRVVACSPPRPGGWAWSDSGVHDISIHVAGTLPGPATSGQPVALVDLHEAVRRAVATRRAIAAGARIASPTWSSLGAWRLIVDADPHMRPEDIYPGVAALLAHAQPDLLVTARSVLDHGGDVVAAADELHVHRTTLYYRLDRLQDLVGVDLRTKAARTDLQMALWLAAYQACG